MGSLPNLPGVFNLKILNNQTFDCTLLCQDDSGSPINIWNSSALMQVRPFINSPIVIIELSTTNGRICVPLTSVGEITLHIDIDDLLTLEPGSYLYDLTLTDPNNYTSTLVTGTFTLLQGITSEVENPAAATPAPVTQQGVYSSVGPTGPTGPAGTLNLDINNVSKTSNYAIQTSDNGTYFNISGATNDIIFTLPAASPNLNFGFVISASYQLQINAQANDYILFGNASSGSSGIAYSNEAYSFMRLLAISDNQWLVIGSTGQWTIE